MRRAYILGAGVHLQQYDSQSRIPYAPSPDGWYYWTNVWFWDLDNPPAGQDSRTRMSFAVNRGRHPVCKGAGWRVIDPPGSGIVVAANYTPSVTGGVWPGTGSWSPINIVRLTLWSAGRRVGYKLWRPPLLDDDIDNGMLSSDCLGWLSTNFYFGFLEAKICSRHGDPIDAITASPKVHNWNYRHGTKRRDRRVFVAP